MGNNSQIQKQLKKHLSGGEAFMPLDQILEKIPFDQLGVRPEKLPYSFYELFYHIYYTQRDILEYCKEPDYKAPSWPEDYWPHQRGPENLKTWEELVASYFEDRAQLENVISSGEVRLEENVPSGKEHSIFRELLLVIEHTAYHSGQLVIILRHLGLHSS